MSKTAERELTEFAKTDTHSLEATKVCSGCDLLKVLSDFVPTSKKEGNLERSGQPPVPLQSRRSTSRGRHFDV